MRVWLPDCGLKHISMLTTKTEEKQEEGDQVSFNLSLANSLYGEQKRGARMGARSIFSFLDLPFSSQSR